MFSLGFNDFPGDFSVKIPDSKKLGEKLRKMCGGLLFGLFVIENTEFDCTGKFEIIRFVLFRTDHISFK